MPLTNVVRIITIIYATFSWFLSCQVHRIVYIFMSVIIDILLWIHMDLFSSLIIDLYIIYLLLA